MKSSIPKRLCTWVGTVTASTAGIWSDENVRTALERPSHSLNVGVWCAAVSTEDNWRRLFHSDDNSWTLRGIYYEFSFHFVSRTGVRDSAKTGLRRMQQIQQWSYWGSYLVLALCIEIYGFLDHPICRHGVSIFGLGVVGGESKEKLYKSSPQASEVRKHDTELCISNVTAETFYRLASAGRGEWANHWAQWTFRTLNIILLFLFLILV
jgi:hypothetical protein